MFQVGDWVVCQSGHWRKRSEMALRPAQQTFVQDAAKVSTRPGSDAAIQALWPGIVSQPGLRPFGPQSLRWSDCETVLVRGSARSRLNSSTGRIPGRRSPL